MFQLCSVCRATQLCFLSLCFLTHSTAQSQGVYQLYLPFRHKHSDNTQCWCSAVNLVTILELHDGGGSFNKKLRKLFCLLFGLSGKSFPGLDSCGTTVRLYAASFAFMKKFDSSVNVRVCVCLFVCACVHVCMCVSVCGWRVIYFSLLCDIL